LLKVVDCDDEDMEVGDIPFTANATYGHRDDWELQYMIGFAFDEVQHRLSSSKGESAETVAHEAAELLETARERVLEWTVKRWYSCYGHHY
jgi:hypothetical protein